MRACKVFCLLVLLMPNVTVAQLSSEQSDTSYVNRILNFANEQSKRSISQFNSERLQLRQQRLFERIRHVVEDTRSYLHVGVDTVLTRQQLEQYIAWDSVLQTEVRGDSPGFESYRNLATLNRAYVGLRLRVIDVRDKLYRENTKIDEMKYHLDSLSSDSVLLTFPGNDSAAVARYAHRLEDLAREVFPVDSSLLAASIRVQALLDRSNLLLARISSQLNRLGIRRETLAGRSWQKEVPFMWEMSPDKRVQADVISYSTSRTGIALRLYLQNRLGNLAILLAAISVSSVFLYSLRKVLQEEHLLHEPAVGQLVLRYPVLSATILSVSTLQFIFPDPPAVFTVLVNFISALCLTIVFRHLIHVRWMLNWLIFLVLFVFSSAVNLLLVGSVAERWIMLALALAGIAISIYSLLGDRTRLTERRLLYFVILVMIMEVLAVGTNLFGRYNLAKNLMTTGYLSLVVAVVFLWTVRFINEGLELSFHVYTLKDRKLFSINFEKVGTRAPHWLYGLLVVGWLVMVFRNFYAYRLISEPLSEFVLQPRIIGEYSFSIAAILTFILIMLIAAVVSRIVSFFASDRPQTKGEGGGLGSLLLLVRIFIFSLGLFLAFAAAGIPVDKVTIILGALSVGIGFGLQTLVNNLVSGLILAFERPVNVGDIVEVNGQAGVMKSIGFRSSRISTWDGADVIMPNGDLLAGHLINWTGGDTRRRATIDLHVAYGSDLAKVERIIKEILKNEPKVIAFPEPAISFQGFGESALTIQILFWVSHFRERGAASSLIVVAIDAAFSEHNITIPFPQRDIHQRNEFQPPPSHD